MMSPFMAAVAMSGLISRVLRAATSAFGRPPSSARKRTERDRFDDSTASRSITETDPTPRRARFLSTSFPRAPAPTTSTRAAASRSCRHQGMSRSRE
jgi:hypothetical protein